MTGWIVAALLAALGVAVLWGALERKGRKAATQRAALAAAQAVLDRDRVKSADTRREAAELAAAVHRSAIDGHRKNHALTLAAIQEAEETLDAEDSPAEGLRRAFAGLNLEED